jgi:hypothetical protein
MSDFKPVGEFEELPPPIAARIMEQGWPIVTGTIDLSFGCAPLVDDKAAKAVWTTDGKRITVTMGDGALIIAQSREADPLYAERRAQRATEPPR